MAFNHYWTADEPFVGSEQDARRIAVPKKHLYEEIGCGQRQRKIFAEFDERLSFIGDCDAATMAFLVTMRGMNRALIDLIEEPELVHAVMEKGAAIAIEKGKFNIDLGLKILRLNDSVGNMNVISPEHWREFVFPHMKEVCGALHAYDPEVRIYCHICGNILPIAEDLVETGLDCIGPLDPLGHFTPAQVRERVGDAVSLMGGVNTLTFLDGTPEQVIEESVACMHQAGARGGYILGSGCVVPRGASRENLLALREAADTCGVYRQGRLAER
jgi:uroporphyrinogen-III decarboxylase